MWAALVPPVCVPCRAELGVSLRVYVWGMFVRLGTHRPACVCEPGRARRARRQGSRGLRCACGCLLRLPPGSECVATTARRGRAGVNEAFSAPGCIQGLQAAALIRLLSPRQWLRGAGQCVGASGPGSTACCQGCLVSRTRAHHDPVPSSRSGSARPQSDPWETCPSPGPLSPSPPRAWPTVLQRPERDQDPPACTGPLSSGLCPALTVACQGLSLPIYEMGQGVDLKAKAWASLAGPPPRSS